MVANIVMATLTVPKFGVVCTLVVLILTSTFVVKKIVKVPMAVVAASQRPRPRPLAGRLPR